MTPAPELADVHAARRRVAGLVRHTPMPTSAALSALAGAEVRIKLDCLQDTRAFKLRGTGNAVLSLAEQERAAGLVTYSTGNHGRAMAHVARRLGIPAVVCVSERVPAAKIDALARAGCEVVIEGRSQDDAVAVCGRLARERGLFYVDPINDPAFIAGHGTVALEMLEDWPQVDTLVVPVSGGALISGVALAARGINPGIRVIGVSMDRGAAMHASLAAGRPVLVDEVDSLADSLQGGIGLDNRYTFDMVRRLVDELVLVDEQEIGIAMAHALLLERQVLEGAGAAPLAALMFRDRGLFGDRVALLASGAMVDPDLLHRLTAEHASRVRHINRDTI